jgi:hypothetical protein
MMVGFKRWPPGYPLPTDLIIKTRRAHGDSGAVPTLFYSPRTLTHTDLFAANHPHTISCCASHAVRGRCWTTPRATRASPRCSPWRINFACSRRAKKEQVPFQRRFNRVLTPFKSHLQPHFNPVLTPVQSRFNPVSTPG